MSERILRPVSAALAALGAAITGYLLYVRRAAASSSARPAAARPCRAPPTPRCSAVPVAALGLVGFLGPASCCAARGEWARLTQATLALSAFVFSAYLLYIQLAVIGAICQWCLATDVHHDGDRRLGARCAFASARRPRLRRRHEARPRIPKRRPTGWQEAEAASADTLTETPHRKLSMPGRRVALDLG